MKKTTIFFAIIITVSLFGTSILFAQDNTTTGISVVDAKLGTGIQDRMITGEADSFAKNSQVMFWMKLSGAASQEVTVTWKNGATTLETKLSIGGSPWRTWASKTVREAGEWTVSVSSSDGTVLKEMTFKVE